MEWHFLTDGSSDVFFFFSSRRRHTRSKRDWSSDVCSSDLQQRVRSDFHAESAGNHPGNHLQTVRLAYGDRIHRRSTDRGLAIYFRPVIQRIYYGVCGIISALIAGLWLYFGDHVPLRLVLPGLALCTILFFITVFFIDKWLRRPR